MGLFGPTPSVPNTISDKQMADLSRRAQKAAAPTFSTETVRKRLASLKQQRKAQSS